MSGNANNIVQGPAYFYIAPFGSAEPADSAATVVGGPPGGVWVDAGFTETAVAIEEDQTWTDLKVQQVPMAVGARLTDYIVTVKTQMSEISVNNLTTVLNGLTTVTVSSSYTTIDRIQTNSATQPAYAAVIVDGWGPTLASGQAARWRHTIRKVISKPKIMRNYELTKKVVYDVTLQGYWVSPSISPVHEILQTA